MNQPRRMVVVMAHPDDETFGMGGTIAHYSSLGVEIHLICATKGEAGEVDSRYLVNCETIGELREKELECAAKKLGISRIHWLGYRDSGMQGSADNRRPEALVSQPVTRVAQKISALIKSIHPEVVVTFDPIGGYRHPDHIAVHNATKLAFMEIQKDMEKSGSPAPGAYMKLFFHTFPKDFFRFWVKMIRFFGGDPEHFGKNRDINFLEIVNVDYPIDVRVDTRRVLRIRNEAYRCHASQGGAEMRRGIFSAWEFLFGAFDVFTQMIPEKHDQKVYRDLFYEA